MRTLTLLAFGAALVAPGGMTAQAIPPPADSLLQELVRRTVAVMEENATPADVDQLVELYHPDAVHDRVLSGFAGPTHMPLSTDSLRAHWRGRLGHTRAPRVEVTRLAGDRQVVMAEVALSFEIRTDEGWGRVSWSMVLVVEVGSGQILRVVEYAT